jgi:hypothetical protein
VDFQLPSISVLAEADAEESIGERSKRHRQVDALMIGNYIRREQKCHFHRQET